MWPLPETRRDDRLPIAVSIVIVVLKSNLSLSEEQRDDFRHALRPASPTPHRLVASPRSSARHRMPCSRASSRRTTVPRSTLLADAHRRSAGHRHGSAAWFTLTKIAFNVNFIRRAKARPRSNACASTWAACPCPRFVSLSFLPSLATLWILRPLLDERAGIQCAFDDSMIAMGGAVLLFLLPSGDKGDPLLLRWEYAERLPWGVLILFGGGSSLASAVQRTGHGGLERTCRRSAPFRWSSSSSLLPQ